MSKTVKNSLIIFTLVCAVALVVFTVELFIINRNSGDGTQRDSSMSDNEPGELEEPINTSRPSQEDGSLSSPDVDNTADGATAPPSGTRYDMQMTADDTLVWYADDELFDYVRMDSGVIFMYSGDGNATLEILLVHIPYGADARAETFLDGYLDGNESNVGGLAVIRRSPLSGVFVSGVKDGETFEAWIYTIEEDEHDRGIAFVVRYSNDEQRNALFAILDTVDIV